MSPRKGLPRFTNELTSTVCVCDGLKVLSAPLMESEPPSLNISWGEVSSSPRSMSGYLPLLGWARMAVMARLKANGLPWNSLPVSVTLRLVSE